MSALAKFFGRTPLTSGDPDKVVAIGAAIQADITVGNKPDSGTAAARRYPAVVRLETMGGWWEKVIPRKPPFRWPGAGVYHLQRWPDGDVHS